MRLVPRGKGIESCIEHIVAPEVLHSFNYKGKRDKESLEKLENWLKCISDAFGINNGSLQQTMEPLLSNNRKKINNKNCKRRKVMNVLSSEH